MPDSPAHTGPATALLREFGAADIAHPGGALLAHPQRVADRTPQPQEVLAA